MDVDVVVLGTGLTESITAAALSKAGYKVAHIDANPYYGGDDASLSLDELVSWADERRGNTDDGSPYLTSQRKWFTGVSYSGSLPPQSPTIIPAIGPLIDSLIASLLERVAIYDSPGLVKPVPGSKEDVFKNKKLSLLHKRRLMRFLMFAGGEFEDKPELQGNEVIPFAEFLETKFSLDPEAVQVIVYALAFCINSADSTLPALQRVRRYLRSTGRYGPSSFLVGHYGGLGEIAQGFCRTSAVGGTTYILGRRILSIAPRHLSEQLRCDVLVEDQTTLRVWHYRMTTESIPETGMPYSFARCVAVIDRPIRFSASTEAAAEQTSETPDAESGQSAPRGNIALFPGILYISMPLSHPREGGESAEQLLRPLTSPQSSEPSTRTNHCYIILTQHPNNLNPRPPATHRDCRSSTEPYAPHLPEIADSAAINAEKTFWRVVNVLKAKGRPGEDGDSQAAVADVESFWPPLEYVEDTTI
ncbi:GDP dissociation inhibitor-domain-containing protein, partial [Irpex lacteus]